MSSLYEILSEFKQIEQDLLESGGEVDESLEERLAINEDSMQDKLDSYCKLIRIHNGYAGTYQAEIDRLEALKSQSKKLVDNLKTRMLTAIMQYTSPDKKGIRRYDTGLFKLSTHRSGAVEVESMTLLPEDFKVYPDPVPDKKLIKNHLTLGKIVPGAKIVDHITLQIK